MSNSYFYIKRWNAWIPGVHSREDWCQWAAGERSLAMGDQPVISAIPAMLRRRLSPLGRMALAVAWPLLNNEQWLPSVFCSRHGELERTVGLLTNLAQAEPLSPTHFSLSVHNAIGGVFSIARQDPSPISALAAGDEGLSQALLESRMILAEGGFDEVLCVVYDRPLPTPYPADGVLPAHPFAAAFVLGPGDEREALSLTLEPPVPDSGAGSGTSSGELHTLQFLRWLLDDAARSLILPGAAHQWCWRKGGGAGETKAV